MARTTLAWLCAAWLLALAATVQGQQRSYEEVISEAIAEFGEGHWEECRSLFEQAHAMQPNARTLRGLGMVEFELRHYVASLRFLEDSLRDERAPLSAQLRETTSALAERARGFTGRYRPLLTPPDAVLTVDGAPAALEEDGRLLLDAGDHTLTATAAGYDDFSRSLDVRGGDEMPLEIVLKSTLIAPVAIAPVAVQPAAAPPVQAAAPVEPRDDDSVLSRWWFWTLAGVVVTGVVVGLAVAGSGTERDDPTLGDNGVLIMALEVP